MDIPQDVWLYIAQFISDEDLCKMIAVNSVFYHLGMNARYREVRLCYIGEKQIKQLVRLMRVIVPSLVVFDQLTCAVGILRSRNASVRLQ
jgi:hypothetical protein